MADLKLGEINLAVTERFSHSAKIFLQKNNRYRLHGLKEQREKVDGLIIRSKTKIDAAFLNEHPRLKVVVTATSGFDHIDLPLCLEKKLTVMSCPNAHVQSTAELALFLTLACLRKYPALSQSMREGKWQTDHLFGSELAGKTVGVIGLGRIGQRYRKLLEPFGCTFLAYDPYLEDSVFHGLNTRRVSLEEIVKECDIISIHVPKTQETSPLFTASVFEYTSPDLIFINCARGSVVKEEDLVRALIEKKIKAAGLDVFEKEPLSEGSKLLKMKTVTLSPHMGAKTEEAFERASFEAARKIQNFFERGEAEDVLPPRAPWYKS